MVLMGRRCTYSELNGDGEEIEADFLADLVTTGNTGEVHKGGLDDAGLTLVRLENGLGHAEAGVGHGEGGRSSTILGLDDLVTTKLDACGVVNM
jgi:hypothetical protein